LILDSAQAIRLNTRAVGQYDSAGASIVTRAVATLFRALLSVMLAVLSVMLSVDDASAQAQQERPGTVQPGQIERQLEKPPEPTAQPGAIAIPEAGQTPPPNAAEITFVLKQLTIDGVTVYRPDTLRAMYSGLLNRQVTLTEIYALAETLTARYRNDGFILSQVIVPAQSSEDGVMRLQAIEGYIAGVRVEGGSASMNGRVRKYADRVRGERPITAHALERAVLLVNDIPGMQARAVLAPSTTPGASDLVLELTPRRFAAGFSSDTRGSRAQGRQRAFGNLDLYSLPLRGSSLGLNVVTTGDRELSYGGASYDLLLGTYGTKIGISGSYVDSVPQDIAVVPLELKSISKTLSLDLSQTIIRSRSRNLYARATLTGFNSDSTIFGIKDTSERLRAVRVGLTFDASDAFGGVNLADAEYSWGLPEFGSSSNGDPYLSRPTGQVDFQKATLYLARMQSLPANFSVALVANGQYAFTDLLSAELFSVGGEQFGRGYDFAEVLNDHGAAAKIDLRYSRMWKSLMLTPYGFVDYGQVWQRTRVTGLEFTQSVASSGGGLRVTTARGVSGFVEFGQPLTKTIGQEHNRRGRVYVGLSVQ
jgi:hemolysin activation/secretion protein